MCAACGCATFLGGSRNDRRGRTGAAMRAIALIPILLLTTAGVQSQDDSPPEKRTTGLPSLFRADQAADRTGAFKLETTDGEDLSEVTERIEHIEHRDGDTTSAIVGIKGRTVTLNGKPVEWVGSGFFVGPCHVATAAHVVSNNGLPSTELTLGWGARPKNTVGKQNYDVAANFSHLANARVAWMGTTTLGAADLQKLNNEMYVERLTQPGRNGRIGTAGGDAAGDWAIVRLDKCRSPREATLTLPYRPTGFTNYNYGIGMIYWASLGYPGGEFDKITITRCAVINSVQRGARTACRIRGGNSGGPLLFSTDYATVQGITSYGTDTISTFIPPGTAGFAFRLGDPAPPPPGCVVALQTILLSQTRRLDPAAQANGVATPAFQKVYHHAASQIARATGSPSGAFIPPLPDPFWCSVIKNSGVEGTTSAIDKAVPDGVWHWDGLTLRVERIAGAPKATVSGGFFLPGTRFALDGFEQVTHGFGRRIVVSARGPVPKRSGPRLMRWTIDFLPGKPPLFSSFEGDGSKTAVLQWFERGPAAQEKKL